MPTTATTVATVVEPRERALEQHVAEHANPALATLEYVAYGTSDTVDDDRVRAADAPGATYAPVPVFVQIPIAIAATVVAGAAAAVAGPVIEGPGPAGPAARIPGI